jgi:hypothetical protein
MHHMGCSALYFSDRVQSWLWLGWLKSGNLFLDFGAQEFNADDADTRRELRAFLRKQQVSQYTIDAALQGALRVSNIFEAIGVRYTAVDVDGSHGSKFLDLNTSQPPASWRNTFDFINNEGTLEHLVNPINGFQLAHEMVKAGGVVRHNFPLIGWREHGFLYPTTKFYACLVGDNRYESLQVRAWLSGSTLFEDAFFKDVSDENGVAAKPTVTDIWGELIYRKTADRPFVIPVDHVGGPDAASARERLIENHRSLALSRPYPPGIHKLLTRKAKLGLTQIAAGLDWFRR